MGVTFAAWIERDPEQTMLHDPSNRELWWERNFYPSVDMIMKDLHEKGLIEAGEYAIEIDW